MKTWSLLKPPDNWRIKIYFDTNILMFLSDVTYPGLNYAVDYFNEKNMFVDLISSEYALFEFLENRKKKHYKQHLKEQKITDSNNALKIINSFISFSGYKFVKSSFKWNNYYSYNVAGYSYLKIYSETLEKVEKEIKSLRENIGVNYEENVFNEELFSPTKQLCLTSRISRQDCMITTSAMYPKNSLTASDVIIWTGDEDYYKAFHECPEVQNIFPGNLPIIEWISKITYTDKNGKNKDCNLEVKKNEDDVKDFIKNKLIYYIINKNATSFIGMTGKASSRQDVIYIHADKKVTFPQDGIFLTIIGKELDFIISSKKVQEFWLDGEVLNEQTFHKISDQSVISAKWSFTDAHADSVTEIIKILKEPGHFVFLNY